MTEKELRALRRALPWRDGLALQIMRDTGLRVSDALALTVADLERPAIEVVEHKTGMCRTVRLKPSTRKELKQYTAGRDPDERIISCDRSTVYRSIRQAADRLDLDRIGPHSARKAYAKAYCRKHGTLATQAELGHSHLATTLLYLYDVTPPGAEAPKQQRSAGGAPQ